MLGADVEIEVKVEQVVEVVGVGEAGGAVGGRLADQLKPAGEGRDDPSCETQLSHRWVGICRQPPRPAAAHRLASHSGIAPKPKTRSAATSMASETAPERMGLVVGLVGAGRKYIAVMTRR